MVDPIRLFERGDWVVVDTETTGKDRSAEPVEIAVLGAAGTLVFASTLRPTKPASPGATRLHGLTEDLLRGAPAFDRVYPRLLSLLRGRPVIAYFAEFERRILGQACTTFRLPPIECTWVCALDLYEAARGFRPPLHIACEIEGIALPARRHRAAADARLTWQLVRRLHEFGFPVP